MMSLHLVKDEAGTPQIPFKVVYVHGLVKDSEGQKMSKSKGNVLDPLDLVDGIDLDALLAKRTSGLMQPQMARQIEKQTRKEFPDGIAAYGTDALRFTFCSLASTGRDIKFDMGRVEGYRNFCNKIWNAARYVLMNTEGQDCGQENQGAFTLSLADRWIISCLQRTEAEVSRQLDAFRFDLAAQALYEFIWNQYCDWYLELSKSVLNDTEAAAEQLRGTRRTLVRVMEACLRLAHPFMPFITEEIWQRIAPLAGKQGETIMLQPWPVADSSREDAQAEATIEWLKQVILAIRNIRGEMDIPPGKALNVLLRQGNADDQVAVEATRSLLMKMAKLESLTWLDANQDAPPSATQVVGDLEILVPMAGLIDKAAELARLAKESEKLQREVDRLQAKLVNPQFADKAPAAVVDKERQKLAEAGNLLARVQEQQEKINAL